jgi:hypothetical protein|tara:strand:+ start:812 stop:1414 length:603 start_codon:yes stop_codon:yes gene_type:complete
MARPTLNNTIMTPEKIKMAIKSTQSMGQAALYMGVSKNTFKKYAKQYDLWKPQTNLKGIRKTGNLGSALKHDLKEILEGKNPNPYREDTLLDKAIREGYMACQCSNCSADFSHMNGSDRQPPLILDFLDRNTQNTKVENLRALCFNCVYELCYTKKGWYRHRDTPIGYALDEATPQDEQREVPKDDKLSYIPFEEFQKML